MIRYPLFLSLILTSLFAGATYDRDCYFLSCKRAKINANEKHFEKIPKIIHQIWFGPKEPNQGMLKAWRDYALMFGYEYHFWSETEYSLCSEFMLPSNFKLMLKMNKEKNYWSASDILRLELLKKYGGVYIDCDFNPPQLDGKYVDLETVMSFDGLIVSPELSSRNIGETSIFVCNGFLLSSPDHPVIRSCVEQIYENAMCFYSKKGNFDAPYATGPFFLNKVLNGCFNVVSPQYLHELHMINFE